MHDVAALVLVRLQHDTDWYSQSILMLTCCFNIISTTHLRAAVNQVDEGVRGLLGPRQRTNILSPFLPPSLQCSAVYLASINVRSS